MKWKIIFILACLVAIPVTLSGQKRAKKVVVSGVVSDTVGNLLESVSIFVDDKNTEVMTDTRGYYSIKVRPTIKTISAFSLFFGAEEIEFTGQKIINFRLKGDIPDAGQKQSDPDKVDIGYQSVEKGEEANNVKSVDIDESSAATYSDIYDMIKKEVPGVIIRNGTIYLRGVSSFQLSSQPLFVIDGQPVTTVDGINPNEVESLSILNGASAAIYGSRGSNGVILIRMKSGKKKDDKY